MLHPRIILQGDQATASAFIGLAKKFARQTHEAGIRNRTYDLGSVKIRVEHYGSTVSKAWVSAAVKEWSFDASEEGGFEVRVDEYDISEIPTGAIFDLHIDAVDVPDKFVITYDGVVVLNTGWRGSLDYNYVEPYKSDGGIAGLGAGTFTNVFKKKKSVNSFTVTVYGGEPGTVWYYTVKAHL